MDKNISEELFNKIRSKFPRITMGDAKGLVTNKPEQAKFFDFSFTESGEEIGSVTVTIDEEKLSVMYSESFLEDIGEITQNKWFDFLRELRRFSKKRLLDFDVRNITKTNLDRRDYQFIAQQKFGDTTMNESRLYGTSRNSFQNVGSAKIHIRHSQPVNTEIPSGRTQYIESIFIESDTGEKFKYPFKHLNGARAAARHISAGGNLYDSFGQHITGLSEELNHLRKFKTYVSRNAVMAEGMTPYMDTIIERIGSIKKEINSIQRQHSYKHMVEKFVPREDVEVPENLAQNWIEQLTVKQFNEELQDVFPYIYKLIGETDRVKMLGPDDIVAEDRKTKTKESSRKTSFEEKFKEWADNLVDSALEEDDDNKKPDEDGDGVPDWADKKPGEDDDEKEKAKARRRHLANISRTRAGGSKGRKSNKEAFHSNEEKKIPVTEYVLSMYDRETGRFPKGETSVLTGVEKEYGEQAVPMAQKFIGRIHEKFKECNAPLDRPMAAQDPIDDLDQILYLATA